MSSTRSRVAAAGAGAFALALLSGGVAFAAPVDGTVAVNPANGRLDTAPTLVTSGVCSNSTATNFQVYVSGAGFPANTSIVGNSPQSLYSPDTATGGFDIPLSDTITDYAQTNGVTITAGTMTFDVQCKKAFGGSLGDFFGSVTVTPSTGATGDAGTYATPTTSPNLPEAPVAVVLPLAGLAIAGGVVVARRRRQSATIGGMAV